MNNLEALRHTLKQGMVAQGLDALDGEPLLQYLSLLHTWNKAYNLTAIREPQDMVRLHLLDSLAILPFLEGARILDVGTGPGLPGIPIAIARPGQSVTLLDSNGKKVRFLREVVRVLELHHVEVVHARVEDYTPATGFDTIVTRAFSHVDAMVEKTAHLLNTKGVWLAMKGKVPDNELDALSQRPGLGFDVLPYTVKEIEGARCCIKIKQSD